MLSPIWVRWPLARNQFAPRPTIDTVSWIGDMYDPMLDWMPWEPW
ncbi:MAG: hypothetical protein R3F17_09480 [Planctomycetota bacterium]